MTLVSRSKRSSDLLIVAAALALCVGFGVAQGAPSIAFVSVVSRTPLTIAAPARAALALSLAGTVPADARLKVYGLHAASGQLRPIIEEDQAQFRKRNIALSGDAVLPLDDTATTGFIELLATLTDSRGSSKAESRFVLDQAEALREAPSRLRRAYEAGSALLATLLRAYEQVRADGNQRLLTAPVRGGAIGMPVALNAAGERILQIALCADGAHVASVHRSGATNELRVAETSGRAGQVVVRRAADIRTPIYAADHRLFFVESRSLFVADAQRQVRAVETPFRSIEGIFAVRALPAGLELHVRAVPSDEIGLAVYAALAITDAGTTIDRFLPDNGYYRGYATLRDDLGVVYPGQRGTVSGIHVFEIDGTEKTLYECAEPGQVAVASNGTRVAFTCGT